MMPDLSLDLRYLRYAQIAAQHGSFRQAAAKLDVSQSTLTRRIRLLEHRIGFKIFDRDHSGIRLTAAGRRFLEEASLGVTQLDRAIEIATSAHRDERAELHVGILASLTTGFLHCVLREFHVRHPAVKVRVHEGTSEDNLKRLAAGELDISFVTGGPKLPGHESALLWNEHVFIVLPVGHRLLAQPEVTWIDIRGETFVVSSGGPGPEIQDYLVRKLSAPGFSPQIDVHDVSRENLMSIVAIGYGITLTSTSTLGTGVSGIAFRRIAGDIEELPSSAIWSPANSKPALRDLLIVVKPIAQDHR